MTARCATARGTDAGPHDPARELCRDDDDEIGTSSNPRWPAPPSGRLTARAAISSWARSPAAAWGRCFKGRDPDLGRDLAVKVLLEQHRDQPDLVRRFVEEAQIGGQLQHPGIVPVYELGTFADRRPYFTMKLVKGQTLAALLGRREPIPATTCRGSWRSSSRSARRWPTPTPAA